MKHSLRTRGRAIAVAVAVAVGTVGCSVTSPFQTSETQSIADGVSVQGFPDVDVENVALVAGAKGGDAVVTGSVANESEKDVTLTVKAGSSNAKVSIPALTLVTLGDEDMTVSGLKEGAGQMAPIEVTVDGKTVPVSVPVLLPTGYYADYAPEGWTPEPEPEPSETSSTEAH